MWTSENRYAYERKAQRYPSDLTDEEWALVEPHLPPPRQRSRHKSARAVCWMPFFTYSRQDASGARYQRISPRGAPCTIISSIGMATGH